jgi:hypothetical protein
MLRSRIKGKTDPGYLQVHAAIDTGNIWKMITQSGRFFCEKGRRPSGAIDIQTPVAWLIFLRICSNRIPVKMC